ncbi:MAG: Xaa-Pro peptidase family protein [Thermoleophilia bacterium]
MRARVDRLRARLDALEAGAFLVLGGTNVRYLTGFRSSNAALLVDRERTLLVTDGRYAEAARAVEDVELLLADRHLAFELGQRLAELTGGPVAFEADHVTYADHQRIAACGLELKPAEKEVERLRAVKDAPELDAIRRSAALLDEAFARLAQERLVGRTELEVARWLERLLREELGAEGLSFDPIVGGGPNGALPHHHPGERPIGANELVVVDAGCVVDGYCSDCTRTFATGPLDDELARAYETCRQVQADALAQVRAGAVCADLDLAVREALGAAGYEVLHGLGHGVGLEIHEEPRLAKTSKDTLVAGNVVTVEPGVYLAGRGGVRVEDLVIVTGGGAEVLSPFRKDLVTVS